MLNSIFASWYDWCKKVKMYKTTRLKGTLISKIRTTHACCQRNTPYDAKHLLEKGTTQMYLDIITRTHTWIIHWMSFGNDWATHYLEALHSIIFRLHILSVKENQVTFHERKEQFRKYSKYCKCEPRWVTSHCSWNTLYTCQRKNCNESALKLLRDAPCPTTLQLWKIACSSATTRHPVLRGFIVTVAVIIIDIDLGDLFPVFLVVMHKL